MPRVITTLLCLALFSVPVLADGMYKRIRKPKPRPVAAKPKPTRASSLPKPLEAEPQTPGDEVVEAPLLTPPVELPPVAPPLVVRFDVPPGVLRPELEPFGTLGGGGGGGRWFALLGAAVGLLPDGGDESRVSVQSDSGANLPGSPVPEPATLVLLVGGLVAAWRVRR